MADNLTAPGGAKGSSIDDKEAKEAENGNSRSTSDFEDNEAQGINEAALIRKIDLRLLPAVGILYLLSFLDRSNGENPECPSPFCKFRSMCS